MSRRKREPAMRRPRDQAEADAFQKAKRALLEAGDLDAWKGLIDAYFQTRMAVHGYMLAQPFAQAVRGVDLAMVVARVRLRQMAQEDGGRSLAYLTLGNPAGEMFGPAEEMVGRLVGAPA